AREKGGPTLLEIKTYRYKGHSISDPQKYRSKDEVDEYRGKDPIQQIIQTILTEGHASQELLDSINKRVDEMVAASVQFAEESPWPDESEVLKDVYVDTNYPFIID
ncbi:pyruvate dehydrogenase (acetyl-transferring) E1 component subunit alpha, partial [Candidatus Dependentiae bacterium]|nr:pyruvate dehydrogenase (acetyl-transferring) E1 component subunit alpha [Candidatus Dependentiae bacterium]